eukprot:Skav201637  [mRNA]  locus=scaffold3087:54890:57475:+ [translate_table: standard]
MIDLALLCDRMDTDKSGALSLEEMLHGDLEDNWGDAAMQRCSDAFAWVRGVIQLSETESLLPNHGFMRVFHTLKRQFRHVKLPAGPSPRHSLTHPAMSCTARDHAAGLCDAAEKALRRGAWAEAKATADEALAAAEGCEAAKDLQATAF